MARQHIFPVKIQRPLASNTSEGMARVLIYNEDRSIVAELPMSAKDRRKVFRGQEVKCFWNACIIETGPLKGQLQLTNRIGGPDALAW